MKSKLIATIALAGVTGVAAPAFANTSPDFDSQDIQQLFQVKGQSSAKGLKELSSDEMKSTQGAALSLTVGGGGGGGGGLGLAWSL